MTLVVHFFLASVGRLVSKSVDANALIVRAVSTLFGLFCLEAPTKSSPDLRAPLDKIVKAWWATAFGMVGKLDTQLIADLTSTIVTGAFEDDDLPLSYAVSATPSGTVRRHRKRRLMWPTPKLCGCITGRVCRWLTPHILIRSAPRRQRAFSSSAGCSRPPARMLLLLCRTSALLSR